MLENIATRNLVPIDPLETQETSFGTFGKTPGNQKATQPLPQSWMTESEQLPTWRTELAVPGEAEALNQLHAEGYDIVHTHIVPWITSDTFGTMQQHQARLLIIAKLRKASQPRRRGGLRVG
jgi:hypothetical protein